MVLRTLSKEIKTLLFHSYVKTSTHCTKNEVFLYGFLHFFCRDSYVDKGELLIDLKHVDMVSVL